MNVGDLFDITIIGFLSQMSMSIIYSFLYNLGIENDVYSLAVTRLPYLLDAMTDPTPVINWKTNKYEKHGAINITPES